VEEKEKSGGCFFGEGKFLHGGRNDGLHGGVFIASMASAFTMVFFF
jgi:hypothetical protein